MRLLSSLGYPVECDQPLEDAFAFAGRALKGDTSHAAFGEVNLRFLAANQPRGKLPQVRLVANERHLVDLQTSEQLGEFAVLAPGRQVVARAQLGYGDGPL